MEAIDPATGRTLPADSIQRILFITNKVHVYNIPPMVAGKGHVAANWTADGNKRQIFTARVRVIETSIPEPGVEEKLKADIVLEDASNGQLFAAAPYTAEAVVESVSDSSRFFALRVQDEAGRKASLGIGFEERSEAFDFGVSLQEARKSLGWDQAGPPGKLPAAQKKEADEKRDYSLKEGETITVNLPGRFQRRRPEPEAQSNAPLSSFSLAPPPSASSSRGSGGILPPPPSAQSVRSQQSGQSTQGSSQPSAADLGFDDGKFGEFA
jgi:adaptin ear-binding coat-associated protein 1/2